MKTYITRITLQGFKSFNKKISIPFSPHLNIITGPNGSGKSNIIDAVSFVLGRISAKSMRAERLTELIFRGTETKKPAEYATVSLYLDNSQKVFPFEDKEISITRKVNRNGYIVYKLNGKNTTREKILEVLSIIKIKPDSYNIIQQGDVTRIIEMSPQERREIIDEIAGIAEYNEKKEKALKDLDEVDRKLREIEIIVTQKYEIFKKLEEERKLVLKYQELQKELHKLKASYWKIKEEILNEKLQNVLKKIEEKKKKIEECEKEIEENEKKLIEHEKSLKELIKTIIEFSKKISIEDEVSKLRTRLLLIKERIEIIKREIERVENLITKLENLKAKKLEIERIMSKPVKEILNLKMKGVYGTLADLIKVPEEYKVAIEVAAAQHLFDIIVENEDVAIACIEFLKREKIGRATFLPLNKIKPQEFKEKEFLKIDGVIGIASKLISYDRKYQAAIEFVFGNTLIIENLEAAKKIGIGKIRMVTLEGDLVERSGAISGGYLTKEKSLPEIEEKEIEKYRETKLQYLSELQNLLQEEKEIEKKLKETQISEESKKIIDLEKIRITSEREIEKLRNLIRSLNEKRITLEMELNKYAIEKVKIETELENTKKEAEKYKSSEIIKAPLEEVEDKLKKVEDELNKIGSVNIRALEEYEKFKLEFEEIKTKYDKILEEKKSILRMIEEIENKKKEIFFSTLTRLNEEFSKIFKEMCNGEGKLQLEDNNNLDSGLVIEVTFPQKKPINIDALSGGEKTLTAIAFLFALQRLSPSAFYLLDEIDAALDKENTIKVAEWLKKESLNTQFILISHNDITLKYADRLYGCTLEEGETKVLALELPK